MVELSSLEPGSIIKINEDGTLVDFYVAKHNYENSLNDMGRTLVVRKDCYDSRQWHSSNVNAYASSAIDSWLNSTYKNLLDADIRGVIGTTKIKYALGNGNTNHAVYLNSSGNVDYYYCTDTNGSRPAFALPVGIWVNDDGTIEVRGH